VQARKLEQVRAVLASPEFRDWWDQLARAREAARSGELRREELDAQAAILTLRAELSERAALDLVYAADERERTASRLQAETLEVENLALAGVERFEKQREVATLAWHKLNQCEQTLEKASGDGRASARAALDEARAQYQREEEKRDAIWLETEGIWTRAFELSLLATEERIRVKRDRHTAESLLGEAEERKRRAARLRQDAQDARAALESSRKQLEAVRAAAAARFGCAAGEDFLYWRQEERHTMTWCVALVADTDQYNLEVRPLEVYQADRNRGAYHLEAAAEAKMEGDAGREIREALLAGRRDSE
jgi:hypothetical protein